MGNILNGALDFTKLKYLPSEHPEFPLLLLEPGDILFNRTNSAELVGKTAVYRGYPKKCSFASYLIRVRLREGIPEWVSYYLNSSFGRAWIKTVASQQCGQANVNGSKLKELEIPFPPVEEQRRIVARIEELFSRLDAGVAALRHAKAQLQRYRQSVLAAAVTGQLTEAWREQHPDTEPAEELLKRILEQRRVNWNGRGKYREPESTEAPPERTIPASWAWLSVAQAGVVQLGRQRSPKNRSKDYPTKYIRAANITEEGIDTTDVLDMEFTPDEFGRFQLRPGDLVVSEASGSPDQVGKPALWKGQIPNCCFQNTVIRLRPIGLSSEYLLTFFKHCYSNKVFAEVAGGVGINHLSAAKFSRIPIALPPAAEQHQIVAEVEARTTAIDHLEAELDRQITRSNHLRHSTLASAFSGNLIEPIEIRS